MDNHGNEDRGITLLGLAHDHGTHGSIHPSPIIFHSFALPQFIAGLLAYSVQRHELEKEWFWVVPPQVERRG
jgi:hypothetical protein